MCDLYLSLNCLSPHELWPWPVFSFLGGYSLHIYNNMRMISDKISDISQCCATGGKTVPSGEAELSHVGNCESWSPVGDSPIGDGVLSCRPLWGLVVTVSNIEKCIYTRALMCDLWFVSHCMSSHTVHRCISNSVHQCINVSLLLYWFISVSVHWCISATVHQCFGALVHQYINASLYHYYCIGSSVYQYIVTSVHRCIGISASVHRFSSIALRWTLCTAGWVGHPFSCWLERGFDGSHSLSCKMSQAQFLDTLRRGGPLDMCCRRVYSDTLPLSSPLGSTELVLGDILNKLNR